jgi:hypothetical protein
LIDIEQLRAEMEDETSEVQPDNPSLLKELDNPTTAATGAVGATMLGVVAFDAIKNGRSEEGDRLFQGSIGWMLGLGGAILLGTSLGRLSRGHLAQKEAEEYLNMMNRLEADYEEEKEAEEEKRAEQQTNINNNAMMLSNPEQFTLAPLPYDMGLGFGEYGNAVGQSLLTYAQK